MGHVEGDLQLGEGRDQFPPFGGEPAGTRVATSEAGSPTPGESDHGHARLDRPGVSRRRPFTHFQARASDWLPPRENSGSLSMTAQMVTSPMYAWWPSKNRRFMKRTRALSQSFELSSRMPSCSVKSKKARKLESYRAFERLSTVFFSRKPVSAICIFFGST